MAIISIGNPVFDASVCMRNRFSAIWSVSLYTGITTGKKLRRSPGAQEILLQEAGRGACSASRFGLTHA